MFDHLHLYDDSHSEYQEYVWQLLKHINNIGVDILNSDELWLYNIDNGEFTA
jgi:hypothetical protein